MLFMKNSIVTEHIMKTTDFIGNRWSCRDCNLECHHTRWCSVAFALCTVAVCLLCQDYRLSHIIKVGDPGHPLLTN